MMENPLLSLAKKQLRSTRWSVEDAEELIAFIRERTNTTVVKLDIPTTEPIPVEHVLANALLEHRQLPFDRVLIIGMRGSYCCDEYFATSESDAGTHLFDMERFRFKLMVEADKRVSEG